MLTFQPKKYGKDEHEQRACRRSPHSLRSAFRPTIRRRRPCGSRTRCPFVEAPLHVNLQQLLCGGPAVHRGTSRPYRVLDNGSGRRLHEHVLHREFAGGRCRRFFRRFREHCRIRCSCESRGLTHVRTIRRLKKCRRTTCKPGSNHTCRKTRHRRVWKVNYISNESLMIRKK